MISILTRRVSARLPSILSTILSAGLPLISSPILSARLSPISSPILSARLPPISSPFLLLTQLMHTQDHTQLPKIDYGLLKDVESYGSIKGTFNDREATYFVVSESRATLWWKVTRESNSEYFLTALHKEKLSNDRFLIITDRVDGDFETWCRKFKGKLFFLKIIVNPELVIGIRKLVNAVVYFRTHFGAVVIPDSFDISVLNDSPRIEFSCDKGSGTAAVPKIFARLFCGRDASRHVDELMQFYRRKTRLEVAYFLPQHICLRTPLKQIEFVSYCHCMLFEYSKTSKGKGSRGKLRVEANKALLRKSFGLVEWRKKLEECLPGVAELDDWNESKYTDGDPVSYFLALRNYYIHFLHRTLPEEILAAFLCACPGALPKLYDFLVENFKHVLEREDALEYKKASCMDVK